MISVVVVLLRVGCLGFKLEGVLVEIVAGVVLEVLGIRSIVSRRGGK